MSAIKTKLPTSSVMSHYCFIILGACCFYLVGYTLFDLHFNAGTIAGGIAFSVSSYHYWIVKKIAFPYKITLPLGAALLMQSIISLIFSNGSLIFNWL